LAARPTTHPPVLLETLKPVDSSDATDVEGQGDSVHEHYDQIEDDNPVLLLSVAHHIHPIVMVL